MKKYLIAASLMLSVSVFAQKDELKDLKKLSRKIEAAMEKNQSPSMEDAQEFKRLLDATEAKLGSADDKQKIEYYYYKGGYSMATMNTDKAIESFKKVVELEKSIRKDNYSKEIEQFIFPELRAMLINQASELGKQQNYKAAYPLYEKVYRISPKDTVYLYNAAAYAVNSQQYPQALEYYKELQRLGFTGSVLNYTARNIE